MIYFAAMLGVLPAGSPHRRRRRGDGWRVGGVGNAGTAARHHAS